MTKYLYKNKDAAKFNKHGIDLTVFPTETDSANLVHVSVKEGHFQEFYDVESTFIYYIIKGSGTFYLNDEKVQANEGDLVVIPPKTRIYYFGNMEMVLVVTPAFKEANERHVRFVDRSEMPA